ncbi:MAG TPA: hypothetical protein ENJ48_01245 [Anaerolineae bacterium]|nr:hypothetical protein [Anaerolineae bacterium]
MNREETLAWIEDVLDALDQSEVIEIIEATISDGLVSDAFFETLDAETERLKAAGDHRRYDRLLEIARTVAIARQNRKENL